MAEDTGSVSKRIRGRLQAKQQRFHANDNISAFIQPGEIEELTKEVAAKMSAVKRRWIIAATAAWALAVGGFAYYSSRNDPPTTYAECPFDHSVRRRSWK